MDPANESNESANENKDRDQPLRWTSPRGSRGRTGARPPSRSPGRGRPPCTCLQNKYELRQ